jgi:hypothetical protein
VLLTLSLLEDQPRHGYEIGRLIDMAPQAHFISTPPPYIPCCIGSKNAAGSKGAAIPPNQTSSGGEASEVARIRLSSRANRGSGTCLNGNSKSGNG